MCTIRTLICFVYREADMMTNVLADRLSVNLDWPEPFVTLAPNCIYHAGVLKSNIRQVIFCAHWSHNCDMSNEKDVWKQKKCEMCVQLNCLCKNSHNDVEFIATTKCNTSVLSSAVHPPPPLSIMTSWHIYYQIRRIVADFTCNGDYATSLQFVSIHTSRI